MTRPPNPEDAWLLGMPEVLTSQFRWDDGQARRARIGYIVVTILSGLVGLATPLVIGYTDAPDIRLAARSLAVAEGARS